MQRRSLTTTALLISLLLAPPLYAAEDNTARILNQKLMLLDTLVNQSRKGKEIEASSSSEAKELLAQARELITIARTTFYEGDLATAEQAVNDALKSFDTAKLMLKHAGGSTLRNKKRFEKLSSEIASLRASLSATDGASLDHKAIDALIAQADRHVASKDYVRANGLLQRALKQLAAAANRDYQSDVTDYIVEPATSLQGSTLVDRSRYRELRQTITSLLDGLGDAQRAGIDQSRLQTLHDEAAERTRHDDYAGANALLNDAYQMVASAASSGYSDNTVVYRLDFDSPREEYEYELRRYLGNQQLVDTLLERRSASPSHKLVVRYREQAEETRERAEQFAADDDHQQALTTIEEAARQLKRAMGLLGLRF